MTCAVCGAPATATETARYADGCEASYTVCEEHRMGSFADFGRFVRVLHHDRDTLGRHVERARGPTAHAIPPATIGGRVVPQERLPI